MAARQSSPAARNPAPAPAAEAPAAPAIRTHVDSGVELDELARRLLEPVSRLLRADLRQGRERAGHPHDTRR
ncbi:MAG TPA: hypothetical protein VFX70_13820 [Mycobacteriales bacterium]|nr:hypothetical protein [Mycobacteriales bacterium]